MLTEISTTTTKENMWATDIHLLVLIIVFLPFHLRARTVSTTLSKFGIKYSIYYASLKGNQGKQSILNTRY